MIVDEVFCIMNIRIFFALFFLGFFSSLAQTKVSGYVFDEDNLPISFANIIFKGSTQGTITDENGKFYLESSDTWSELTVSFIGYETIIVPLTKKSEL